VPKHQPRRSQNPIALKNAAPLMEAVVLFTEAPKNDRLTKSINQGGHFIYGSGQKMPDSENRFTEAVVLRQPSPEILYF
jgi:hypothetical protein